MAEEDDFHDPKMFEHYVMAQVLLSRGDNYQKGIRYHIKIRSMPLLVMN
jgi:hypothetical protein